MNLSIAFSVFTKDHWKFNRDCTESVKKQIFKIKNEFSFEHDGFVVLVGHSIELFRRNQMYILELQSKA